jgi:hypothetical protein
MGSCYGTIIIEIPDALSIEASAIKRIAAIQAMDIEFSTIKSMGSRSDS